MCHKVKFCSSIKITLEIILFYEPGIIFFAKFHILGLFKDMHFVWQLGNIFEEDHGLSTYHTSKYMKYWYNRST